MTKEQTRRVNEPKFRPEEIAEILGVDRKGVMRLTNKRLIEVLTFDCYGTLIDSESGIWNALKPVFARRGIKIQRDRGLELYGRIEFEMECGEFKEYRTILRRTMEGICVTSGFALVTFSMRPS